MKRKHSFPGFPSQRKHGTISTKAYCTVTEEITERRHLGGSSCLSVSFLQSRVRNNTFGFISVKEIKTNGVSSDSGLAHSVSKLVREQQRKTESDGSRKLNSADKISIL